MEEIQKDGGAATINSEKVSVADLSEYLSDLQAGQYQNNKQFIEDEVVVCAGETEASEKVIFIFGKCFPLASSNSKKELNALRRYFYFTMDEIVNSKYYLFYFNTGLAGYGHIQFMYTLMRHLPDKYYQNLHRFFIVAPSFMVKSYNFFSTPSKLKNKLEYLKSAKEIYSLDFYRVQFGVKLQNFLKTSEVHTRENMNEKDKIFGVRLEELEISETTFIPRIIEELIAYFKFSEDHLKEQGIFRKVPRVDDVKEMEKHLLSKDYEYVRQYDDPHVVASVLKRFLNQLPEPIFPFKQYDLIKRHIVSISDLNERKMRIKAITQQLSELNYRVLGNIIELLHKVESFSEFNLMKMEALTRIFSPTLIRCRPYAEKLDEAKEELMMSKIVLDVVQTIFLCHEELFEDNGSGIINRRQVKIDQRGGGVRKDAVDDEEEYKNNNSNNNNKQAEIFKSILNSFAENEEEQEGTQIDFRELYRQQYEADNGREIESDKFKENKKTSDISNSQLATDIVQNDHKEHKRDESQQNVQKIADS